MLYDSAMQWQKLLHWHRTAIAGLERGVEIGGAIRMMGESEQSWREKFELKGILTDNFAEGSVVGLNAESLDGKPLMSRTFRIQRITQKDPQTFLATVEHNFLIFHLTITTAPGKILTLRQFTPIKHLFANVRKSLSA